MASVYVDPYGVMVLYGIAVAMSRTLYIIATFVIHGQWLADRRQAAASPLANSMHILPGRAARPGRWQSSSNPIKAR